MYSSNTVPAALSTINLVQEESNPKILEAQEQKLAQDTKLLQDQAEDASTKIEQDRQIADQQIEMAGANATAGLDAGVRNIQTMANKFVKPGIPDKVVLPKLWLTVAKAGIGVS